MKKSLILVSTLLLFMNMLRADIPIKTGWQLVGATQDMNTSIFNNICIDYIWKYDVTKTTPEWKIHVANGTDYAHSMTAISSFVKGESFWVKASNDCNISLTSVTDANSSNPLPFNLFKSGESWKGLVYGTVTSPFTGKVWLDRNLGASQVCTALDDTACYGDYYQWGRATDGHEKIDSNTTQTLATAITTTDTSFVIGTLDWTSVDIDGASRLAQWNQTDGNSICPVGFRAPTYTEINEETILASAAVDNSTDAFSGFLKIPSAGYRDRDGSLHHQGLVGYFWVNHVNSFSPSYSYYLYFGKTLSGTETVGYRADAYPIRCVRN